MSRRLKLFWRVSSLFLFFICILGGYAAYLLLTGNFHRLPDGQVYRSGQLSPEAIKHLVQAHDLRSVLNLCGPSPRESWYRAETNITASLGVQHFDVKLLARKSLTEAEMDSLVKIMRELPKPMLIHCSGGADRTSLACALYRYDVIGEPASVAAGELSFLYGHIPYFKWRYSIAMDRSFWSHAGIHASGQHPSGAPM